MKVKISKKVIIIVVIVLIILGVGGYFAKQKFFPANQEKVVEETVGPLVELESFMVNLNDGGMLKAEITIEGMNEKSEEKLIEKEIFFRDRINSVISSKGINDVRTNEGREILRKELITELNKICPGEVKDVLFSSFLYSY